MTIQDYIRKLEGQVSRLPEARLYALKGAAEEAHNGKEGMVSRIHDKHLATNMSIMKKKYSRYKKKDYRRGDFVPYIELRARYGLQTNEWDLEFTGTLRNEFKILRKRSEGSPFMFGGPNFVSEITAKRGPDGDSNIVKATFAEGYTGKDIFKLSISERIAFVRTFAKLFESRLFRLN